MKFTQSDTSVYMGVRDDSSIEVNEAVFKRIAIEEAEAVWSDYNLANIDNIVEDFEAEYGPMDASGLYQLTNQNGQLRVVAHSAKQYPLDPALENTEEPGALGAEFSAHNEHLIDAQKQVASRITDRLDEFVTRD